MQDDSLERHRLTFSQAHGPEPLPSQLTLSELPVRLRNRLWAAVYASIPSEYLEDTHFSSQSLVLDFYIDFMGYPIHKVGLYKKQFQNYIYPIFEEGPLHRVLTIVEWFARNTQDGRLINEIDIILEDERCAYRIHNGSIIPISTPEEGEAIRMSLDTLDRNNFSGAKSHLTKAASLLSSGDFPGSIRESINSVESVCRNLTDKNKFSDAIDQLSKYSYIHPALKGGMKQIYGYSSDEQGIRHPIVDQRDQNENITEREALFMIGACASIITFILSGAKD